MTHSDDELVARIRGGAADEFAELTGSSGAAVRVRALRARAKLRKALERLEHEAT